MNHSSYAVVKALKQYTSFDIDWRTNHLGTLAFTHGTQARTRKLNVISKLHP